MADTTTELEVLDQIVEVLGGQSGQHKTVVPVLQQIKELLEAGITDPEAIAEAVTAWLDEHPEATTTVQDGSITGVKIADDTIPDAKLAQTGGVLSRVESMKDAIFTESPNLYDASADEVGLLNVGGAVASQYTDYFTTGFMPVEYGDTICIQDTNKVSSTNVYICEYTENKALVGTRQTKTIGLNVTSDTYAISNETAAYVRISFGVAWTKTSLMVSVGASVKPYSPYGALFVKDGFVTQIKTPLYVSIKSGVLRAITKYTATTDLCVAFARHGGNNLPDFSALSIINNADAFPVSSYADATTFLDITTDWHAPFIVKALSNIDGDQPDSAHFTGGNHNYSNSGASGYTPTAVCDTLVYCVDGAEVEEFEGYCKTVEARWSNRVQATNTKKADGTGRYVLRENHRLRFDGDKWESSVSVIPLEDIAIQTYYGFQAQVNSNYSNIYFVGATNRGLYTNAESHVSGDNKANGAIVYGDTHKVELDLDTTYDIGDRRFYSGTSGVFSTAAKVYLYLIAGLANAQQNNLYTARASYRFSHV